MSNGVNTAKCHLDLPTHAHRSIEMCVLNSGFISNKPSKISFTDKDN